MHLDKVKIFKELTSILFFNFAWLITLGTTIYQTPIIEEVAEKNPHQKEIWYEYKPSVVIIVGVLSIQQSYGPPGYGETPKIDKIRKFYVIKLDIPINLKGNSTNDTIKGVRKIQLVIDYDVNNFKLVGHKVAVKGTLHQAVFGFEYTKVILDVQSLSLYKPKLKKMSQ